MKQLTAEALSLLDRVSEASQNSILAKENILKDVLATIPELTSDVRTQDVASELLGEKLATIAEKMISPDQIVSLIDQDEELLLYQVSKIIIRFGILARDWKTLHSQKKIFA